MTTIRPDTSSVDATTATGSVLATSTTRLFGATSSKAFETLSRTASSSSSIASTPVSGPPTLSTSIEATAGVAVTSTSSTTLQWGPAITASPLPNTDLNQDLSSSGTSSQANQGFSENAKRIIIATTVIGGLFILVLLIYAVRQRRKGATFSDIAHFRPHNPSTILLSPEPRDRRLAALPIYRETRYSIRSSQHASLASIPGSVRRTAPVPPKVALRFHSQNPYVGNLWKTAHPPSPGPVLREADASSDDKTAVIKEPEKARLSDTKLSIEGYTTTQPCAEATKSWLRLSVSEVEASPPTPHDSSHAQQLPQDRWSWTNSQAPTTPRYAPSFHSSISSLTRFRNIRSWVRGQTERIDEERLPVMVKHEAKGPVLKNKASLPKLSSAPSKGRLTKPKPAHARIGSLSSITMQRKHEKTLGLRVRSTTVKAGYIHGIDERQQWR